MAKFFTPTRLSENIRETPEGFLLCLDVAIARTGWQEYGRGETPLEVGEDGVVWIYRDSEEVFRPQHVASYNGKSVTIRHPEEFVAPENWKELTYGSAQNVRKGEDKDEDGEEQLLADLLITDEMAIGLVKNGLREVSCGYEAEYEQTGEGEGRQFNIVGNHIALVEQGRAGTSYAIKDHKGDLSMWEKLKEQLGLLSKTIDQAAALEAKKTKKAGTKKTDDEGQLVEMKAKDEPGYDELVKAVKDLGEKIDKAMGASKDEEEEEEPKEKKSDDEEGEEEEAGDDEGEEMKIEERIKALEAAVAKMLKKMSGGDEEEESEEESEDGESEEDMSGDEEKEEEKSGKMGDAARIEILVPGFKAKGKDARAAVLKEFEKTDEGKKVMAEICGGKRTKDSKLSTDLLFMAASTIMKAKRGTGLKGSKDNEKAKKMYEVGDNKSEVMTAEKMNELNAAHWANKK